MGWASGSELAIGVWKAVRPKLPEPERQSVAKKIVSLFEGFDCDTIDEADQLCRDAGLTFEDDLLGP